MRRVSMLGVLADRTRQHHATADGQRLAIMETPTLERYRALLARIYGFEATVEAACLAADGFEPAFVRTHFKSMRLVGDLEALGVCARDVQPMDPIALRAIDALGWLWVIHRHTLLHGLLYRYLATRLPDTMRVAGAYLSVFEGRAGALMRSLGEALDAHAKRGATLRLAAAANEAFRTQHHWYTGELRSRRAA